MPKKVIFIGGTSYSGSTFFHLTLANDPHGFGAGEVRHLFWPEKLRHVSASWSCGCGDPNCRYWAHVKKNGEEHLYESIFDLSPEVEFVVDSSKNVIWVAQQSERLRRQGIEVHHIVIWKTLLEYAHSLQKRDRLQEDKGLANWPRYHRLYNSFIEDWRSVKYSEYTTNQADVLETVCKHIGIPYFPGKERFWEKSHHVLGGNLSSRIHLYSKESAGYQDVRRRTEATSRSLEGTETQHRRVYYEKPDQEVLLTYIQQLRQASPFIDQVEGMLIDRNLMNPSPTIRDSGYPSISTPEKIIRQARFFVTDRMNRRRYGAVHPIFDVESEPPKMAISS